MGGLLLARAARAGGLTLRDLLHLLVTHLVTVRVRVRVRVRVEVRVRVKVRVRVRVGQG